MTRLLLVSNAVPPSASGQARVLGHLLADGAADCLMLSENPPAPGEALPGRFLPLQPRPHQLSERWPAPRFPALNARAGLLRAVWQRAGEIIAAARGFKPQLLLGCTANVLDVPGTALAAARLGVPFAAWLFDDPVYQWPPGALRRFAAWAEPRWARRAAAVVAPNEFMRRDFAARTGVEARIIRNPVDAAAFAPPQPLPPRAAGAPRRVVYTGSVYHAQADAFLNLLRALETVPEPVMLELYTSQSPEQVAALGIAGPRVRVLGHVAQQDSYALQRGADVLFLPLAFHSAIPEVIDSSAPAKLGEFLASGRPVLVHAPASSFLVDHVRGHGAGFVVDRPDPAALAAALRQALDDAVAVAACVARARALAELYRVDAARAAFHALLAACAGR